MAYSQSATIGTSGGNRISFSATKSYTGSGFSSVSESVGVGTDTLVNFTLDVSTCKLFYLHSDRAITVETNATDHSGGDTITLVAGFPYLWTTDSYNTFKMTNDITKLYVTNASGGTATLTVICVADATP